MIADDDSLTTMIADDDSLTTMIADNDTPWWNDNDLSPQEDSVYKLKNLFEPVNLKNLYEPVTNAICKQNGKKKNYRLLPHNNETFWFRNW